MQDVAVPRVLERVLERKENTTESGGIPGPRDDKARGTSVLSYVPKNKTKEKR